MATRKRAARAASKPAPVQPSTLIEIGGRTYQLGFTYGSIRSAKLALRARGIELNLMRSFGLAEIDADTLPELFFAALRVHHPDVTFEDALSLISVRNCLRVAEAIATAYIASMSDPEGGADAERPQ